ncbi:hypothetical protein [Laribacter hongkongensis]|nr:hypothetical protein [Laribacter hongkongensis]MCG9042050.1 hypothetical protein [Laribacter hongkongensis]MCG9069230.1 hypothetical protein [Laribacter hongkongensis]MCG9083893.1 hypothetical protein [Laribacter hongkongensis]MCG9087893.1 hypothetical protein [Laribacter hongkongensis]
MVRQLFWAWLLVVLAGLSIFGGMVFDRYLSKNSSAIQLVTCPDLTRKCTFDGMSIMALSPPKSGHPFQVEINAPSQPVLQFEMVEMAMGISRFTALPYGKNHWRVQVGLPGCVTGSSQWIMDVEVNRQHYRIGFSTQAS